MCSLNRTHPVILLLILITSTEWAAAAIQCYKCSLTAPPSYSNETVRLCSNFDYSDRYIVNCPYSTLCMKKNFSVNLTVPISGVVRDCALQRYDYQDYKNGRWQQEVSIEEPYLEGCSTVDDKGIRNSKTSFCYCRGNLCNAAPATTVYRIVVITVMLAIKTILDL